MAENNIIFRVMILDFIQKTLRLFFGYVTFEASGGFPDRFFDSCKRNGVNLFDITRVNGNFYAGVKIGDYRKMPHIRRNSDMSLRIIEKRGLPFILYRRRNRIGVVIGLLFFVLLLFFLSGSILSISVEGNRDIDANDIIKAFEENGVRVGARKNKIDITAVENKVSTEIPELVWVSLNISGTVATINVREGTKAPEITGNEKPCNIVAKYGGQIALYEVYEGTAEQELNAAVAKGDLLISGIITYKDGTTVLRPAQGKVFAKTEREISFCTDDSYKIYSVRKIRKSYTLDFFGLKITLPPNRITKKTDYLKRNEYEERVFINDIGIPICLSENSMVEAMNADCGKLRKKSIAFDEFLKKVRAQTDITTINGCTVTVDETGDDVSVHGKFSMTEDICEISELLYTEQ